MTGQGPELQGQAAARNMCPEEGGGGGGGGPRCSLRQSTFYRFVQQLLMRLFTVGGSGALSTGIYVGSLTTKKRGLGGQ